MAKQKAFSKKDQILAYIKEVFSLDLRSLALFRVYIALIILSDLAVRSTDIIAHYSDYGVLPRAAAIDAASPSNISIHFISGLWQVQLLLFVIAAIVGIFLLVGYKTKLMTILTWFLFMSLENRNVWVASGADQLLRVLLFWCMFLPLGARYSVDSLKYNISLLPKKVYSLASILYTLQVNYIYLFTAILKFDPAWIRDGTSVYYALHNYAFYTPITDLMNKYLSWSYKYLTYAVYIVEAFAFYFIYSPWKNGLIRTLIIFIFILTHTGFGLGLDIGIFSFVVVAGFVALLPSYFWEKLAQLTHYETQESLKIYFDDDCGFCQKATQFFKTFLLLKNTQLIPGQSDPVIETDMFSKNSWIIEDSKGNKYYKDDALIPLSKTSPILYPLSPLLTSNFRKLFEPFYVTFAKYRKSVCPVNKSRLMYLPPVNLTLSKLELVFISLAFVYITWFNITGLKQFEKYQMPYNINQLGSVFGLKQKWNMFAPHPPYLNAWYVMPAILNNGKIIDAFALGYGKVPDYRTPQKLGRIYENNRWGKYFANMTMIQGFDPSDYNRYICRKWNNSHKKEEQIQEMTMYYMYQYINLSGKEEPVKKDRVFHWYCVLPKPTKK